MGNQAGYPKVHYYLGYFKAWCGTRRFSTAVTLNLEEVTCKSCLKAIKKREAVKERIKSIG